jgi:hypothetical protein
MQGLVSKAAAPSHVNIDSHALRGCALFHGTAPALRGWASLLALALLLVVAGCGDDDDVADAGSGDAGMDAGDDDGFVRPRRDAQTGSDPVPECNRFDPLACGAGQRCQVVIRRAAGEQQFLIYTGCVEGGEVRAEGDPCDPWGGGFLPYRADGLDDELYADPCGDGLFCAASPDVRGHFTCQRACESGRFEGQLGMACGGEGQYCAGPGPYEEVCLDSDDCDPTSRSGCGPGIGCYLRLNDTGTGVLTVCLPTVELPVADGAACQFLNDCSPGSSCWGPTRVPAERWVAADLRCRRSCNVGDEGTDAGSDPVVVDDGEDGGVAGSACSQCVAFDGASLDLSAVSPSLGQCE